MVIRNEIIKARSVSRYSTGENIYAHGYITHTYIYIYTCVCLFSVATSVATEVSVFFIFFNVSCCCFGVNSSILLSLRLQRLMAFALSLSQLRPHIWNSRTPARPETLLSQPCHHLKPNWKPSSFHSIVTVCACVCVCVCVRVCVCVCVCVCFI